jgi:hypothetical protein
MWLHSTHTPPGYLVNTDSEFVFDCHKSWLLTDSRSHCGLPAPVENNPPDGFSKLQLV